MILTDDEISNSKTFYDNKLFLSNILFVEKKDKYFLHVITDYELLY